MTLMRLQGLYVCRWAKFVPAVVILLTGCGKIGTLTGQVTYKGAPVSKATIIFLSENGRAESVKCDNDGNYKIKLPLGKARVAVHNTDQAAPTMMMQGMSKSAQQSNGRRSSSDIEKGIISVQKEWAGGTGAASIPAKYNSADKSGLMVDVAGGSQKYDMPLGD